MACPTRLILCLTVLVCLCQKSESGLIDYVFVTHDSQPMSVDVAFDADADIGTLDTSVFTTITPVTSGPFSGSSSGLTYQDEHSLQSNDLNLTKLITRFLIIINRLLDKFQDLSEGGMLDTVVALNRMFVSFNRIWSPDEWNKQISGIVDALPGRQQLVQLGLLPAIQ